MGDFGNDPSLPLQDETLGGLEEEEHEVEGDQPGVRFEEPGSLLVQIDESHAQHGNSTWQVDGSNQSLGKLSIGIEFCYKNFLFINFYHESRSQSL